MMGARDRFYPLTILACGLGYASYAVSKAGLILLALPLVLILAPFSRAKARVLEALTRNYLGFFTRAWLPLLGVYRVAEISGRDQALAVRPAVYVANHRSFMDSILLLGLLPRTGVVIKARDTRQLAYGLLERHFDLVGVDRQSLSSVGNALDRCRVLLAAGKNLLVFPEGTRARSGRLQPFNRLAFDLAAAARVPVVPILVHSTQPFMARVPGSIFPLRRNEFRIRFLDPEPAPADDTAAALGDRVHRRMARELRELDAGTPWETETRAPARPK